MAFVREGNETVCVHVFMWLSKHFDYMESAVFKGNVEEPSCCPWIHAFFLTASYDIVPVLRPWWFERDVQHILRHWNAWFSVGDTVWVRLEVCFVGGSMLWAFQSQAPFPVSFLRFLVVY